MRISILFLLLSLLLTGCLPKNYLEQLGIITAVGYDKIDNNKLRGSMVINQFSSTSPTTSQVLISEAATSKGLRLNADTKTSHKLVSGQVRLEIYGRDIAKSGLEGYMDTLSRDAKVSDMGYLAIADNQAAELLNSANSEDAPNIGTYMQRLLEKSIHRQIIPNCTLHEFNHMYYDVGIDPVLPLMKLENNKAVIKGLALFKEDSFQDELPQEDIYKLMILKNEFSDGQFQLKLEKDAFEEDKKETSKQDYDEGPLLVSFHEINSKVKISPKQGSPSKQTVHIKMDARLLELSKDIDLKQMKVIDKIEREVEKELTKQLEGLIEQLKEDQIDPVGFGRNYNSKNRTQRLTEKQWRETIPNLDVDIHVKFKMLRHGITE
ncbi:Ger(x)C family spore germination protein [Halobacillus rhizosphaerae]|uniref:Ger(x)C family spore germination protein n=1 Tax=Halobacillus rhizosphaerae TaxID=3064889 RepID=UPI00398A8DE6